MDAPPEAERRLLPDKAPIIGVIGGGDVRAYPLRILNWHEVVNDSPEGPLLVDGAFARRDWPHPVSTDSPTSPPPLPKRAGWQIPSDAGRDSCCRSEPGCGRTAPIPTA